VTALEGASHATIEIMSCSSSLQPLMTDLRDTLIQSIFFTSSCRVQDVTNDLERAF